MCRKARQDPPNDAAEDVALSYMHMQAHAGIYLLSRDFGVAVALAQPRIVDVGTSIAQSTLVVDVRIFCKRVVVSAAC